MFSAVGEINIDLVDFWTYVQNNAFLESGDKLEGDFLFSDPRFNIESQELVFNYFQEGGDSLGEAYVSGEDFWWKFVNKYTPFEKAGLEGNFGFPRLTSTDLKMNYAFSHTNPATWPEKPLALLEWDMAKNMGAEVSMESFPKISTSLATARRQLSACVDTLNWINDIGGVMDSEKAYDFKYRAQDALAAVERLGQNGPVQPVSSTQNLESHAPGIGRQLDMTEPNRHPISGHPLK